MRAALLIALLLPAAPDRPDLKPMKKEMAEQILGHWQLVSASMGGNRDILKEKIRATVLVFTPTEIQIFEDGKRQGNDDAGYQLDASKIPATIDILPKRNSGPKVQGILKLDGDQMTICFSLGDGMRPTSFDSPPNTMTTLMHLRRIRK